MGYNQFLALGNRNYRPLIKERLETILKQRT